MQLFIFIKHLAIAVDLIFIPTALLQIDSFTITEWNDLEFSLRNTHSINVFNQNFDIYDSQAFNATLF